MDGRRQGVGITLRIVEEVGQPKNDLLGFVVGEVLVQPVVEGLGIRELPCHGGQDRRRLFQPSTSSSAETASS